MADYRFSFHERGKEYNPAWMAPEGNVQLLLCILMASALDSIKPYSVGEISSKSKIM